MKVEYLAMTEMTESDKESLDACLTEIEDTANEHYSERYRHIFADIFDCITACRTTGQPDTYAIFDLICALQDYSEGLECRQQLADIEALSRRLKDICFKNPRVRRLVCLYHSLERLEQSSEELACICTDKMQQIIDMRKCGDFTVASLVEKIFNSYDVMYKQKIKNLAEVLDDIQMVLAAFMEESKS